MTDESLSKHPGFPSEEGERRHFAIASLVHELTAIHLTFHSLVLIAVGELGINAKTNDARLLASCLGLLGAAAVILSICRELRCIELKKYWEGKDMVLLDAVRGSFRWKPENSRMGLLWVLIFFYLGAAWYPWLNKAA